MTYAWIFPVAYFVGGIATGCWVFKLYFELPQHKQDEADLMGVAWFILFAWPLYLPPLVGSALAKSPAPVGRCAERQDPEEGLGPKDEHAVTRDSAAGAQVDPTQEETR